MNLRLPDIVEVHGKNYSSHKNTDGSKDNHLRQTRERSSINEHLVEYKKQTQITTWIVAKLDHGRRGIHTAIGRCIVLCVCVGEEEVCVREGGSVCKKVRERVGLCVRGVREGVCERVGCERGGFVCVK